MDVSEIGARLREPFPLASLGFKPQMVKDNRALAVCYIDARDVMDRLDEVVGAENWRDEYHHLDGGMVLCKLSVRFGGEWITKTDVGGESEQPDAGDRLKAAFSDALKRAAVKFGVGRYLYSMPQTWCDYDPRKKQFVETPRIPAQFLPAAERKAAPAPRAAEAKPAPPKPAEPAVPAADFFAFLDQIATAGSVPTLAAVWNEVNLAHRGRAITDDNLKELAAAKDARKAALSGPKAGAPA